MIAPVIDEAPLFVTLSPDAVLIAPAVKPEAVTLSCPTSLEAPTAPPMLTEPEPALILTTDGVALVSRTYPRTSYVPLLVVLSNPPLAEAGLHADPRLYDAWLRQAIRPRA